MDIFTQKLTNFSIGGDEVYALVPDAVKPFGSKVVIVGGKTALEKSLPAIKAGLEGSGLSITDVIIYGKECTFEKGAELATLPAVQAADVIFAVGGGKAIDTVKIINSHTHKPFFTFPTIASTCAAYTEVAAVYTEDHVFNKVFYCGTVAIHAFINSRIIAESPDRFIWAGMGDTLAKNYESAFSARDREVTYATASGVTYSRMCVDPVIKYGAAALEANRQKKATEELNQAILSVIVGTGLAAVFLPEDFNSNVAHAICYGLTTIPVVEEKCLHGEMVAYGVMVLLTLDGQLEERAKLLPLYDAIKLPRKLADLGITLNDIEPILNKAVSVRDIVISPYEVTKEKLKEAMVALEAL